MRVHIIVDAGYEDIKNKLYETGKYEEITIDYSLNTAVAYAETAESPPDCLIIFDGVPVSGLMNDGSIQYDRASIDCITRIRFAWPKTKILMLLAPERKERHHHWYIKALAGFSIHDLYFVEEFNVNDLTSWIETKKEWYDVAEYLGIEGQPLPVPKVQSQQVTKPKPVTEEPKEETEKPSKQVLKGILNKLPVELPKVQIPKLPGIPNIPKLNLPNLKNKKQETADERVIVVWNSHGGKKAETALSLAKELDDGRTVLIELDTTNPKLDRIMGVPKPGMEELEGDWKPWDIGAGVLTCRVLDMPFEKTDISKFAYRYKHGIAYLPCGNTFGQKVRKFPTEDELKAMLSHFEGMRLIISIPCDENNPITPIMWRLADVIYVPDDPEKQTELERIGFKAKAYNSSGQN
ncbi:MAG: hypothetical protein HPY90_05635 [Syntrophothermus sp.]|uniref:hypothetical protein n=1 Tax=Syntrophothermus sp. TaxID=2736299 RepID=UPI00257E2EBA|nr:hypothetical protein [Syntrophothermus sp.]NSW82746.1 hypothetical protein [Syntrophothermus sp.]